MNRRSGSPINPPPRAELTHVRGLGGRKDRALPDLPSRARPVPSTDTPEPDYGLPTRPNGAVPRSIIKTSSNYGASIKPDYDSDDPPPDYGSQKPEKIPSRADHIPLKPIIRGTDPSVTRGKPRGGVQIFPHVENIGDLTTQTEADAVKVMQDIDPAKELARLIHRKEEQHRDEEQHFITRERPTWDASKPDEVIYESDPLTLSDLAKLPELTLDTITTTIEKRYVHDLIYTRCGEILISVNPFKPLELCSSKYHKGYTYASISPAPHLFAVSAKAYQGVRTLQQNQVILVSGESGAGKTEATKLMVQHLMAIGGSEYDTLQDKIIKVNPLLEAFGNAKTNLNTNSSRFAKFLTLSINSSGKIESARIKDYMLEKSRVVHHGPRERTFHAFYALLVGAADDVLESLYIKRGDSFRITGDFTHPSESERKLYTHIFQDVQSVFNLIRLKEEEIQDVNIILAVVLHLGNVDFEEADNDGVIIKNEEVVQKAAALLQLDAEKLTRVLIERKGKMGRVAQTDGEIIELSKNKKQAEDERDAVAKTLYERMFGWLVRKINEALKSEYLRTLPNIGILDICGFENLDMNSFEQLCINLVNEQLQNFMNKKIIEEERLLYLQEGVEISDVDIEGINNDAILHLFMERRNGILAMIDEDSKIEFTNDEKLVTKLTNNFGEGGVYVPPASNAPEFSIRHFAGEVTYDARSFIKKNRDTLSDEMLECLKSSESTLIEDLFTVKETDTGSISAAHYMFRGSRKTSQRFRRPILESTNFSQSINQSRKSSVKRKFSDKKKPDFRTGDMAKRNTHITFFRNSMDELLRVMKDAVPYFVRCIKPNDKLRSGEFWKDRVKVQLQYNGIKEVARIRTFGFPFRCPKNDFEKMYAELAGSQPGRDLCYSIFLAIRADPSQFKIGKTQIFMKERAKKALDEALTIVRRKKEEERRRREEEERLRREAEERIRKLQEETEENRREVEERKMRLSADAEVLRNELDGELNTMMGDLLDPITEVSTPSTDNVYNTVGNSCESSSEETESEEEPPAHNSEPDEDNAEGKYSAAWDITQELTEEEERRDVHEEPILMVLKVIVYILLFLLLLGSFVVQKIALLLMLADLKPVGLQDTDQKRKDIQTIAYVFLEIAICVPYAVFWIITAGKLCFGNFKRPSVWTWIWVFLMENLHTVGMCLLVFRVLPHFDVIRAAMLLTATAILPSLLKMAMASADFEIRGACMCCTKYSRLRKVFRAIFDTLAFLGQASVIPLIILTDFIGSELDLLNDYWRLIETVAAFVLISFGHWENFTDGLLFCNLGEKNWFKNSVLKIRYELQKGRHYPHVVTCPWKIGLTILLGYFLSGDISFEYSNAFETLSRADGLKSVSAILAVTLAAFVAFYVSFGACMFQMQVFSLAFPLLLTTPAVIGVFWLNCHYDFLSVVTFTETECPAELIGDKWLHSVFGGIWWLSLVIVTRHVWKPQVDRTANMARIFLNPAYCGILTPESIMLNRRRHPGKVTQDIHMDDYGNIKAKYYKLLGTKKKFDDEDEEEIEEDSEEEGTTSFPSEGDEPSSPKKEEANPMTPMLYACATMWHETRTEMVQLLKSLHRLDRDQYIRKMANEKVRGFDPEFYNFEAHIFFDDAMELDDNNERVPNRWVKELVASMDVACSSVHGKPMKVHPPTKVPTPYGGQLIWQMPGENLLFVHMKDMSKIRNRKRWSQVMYMYYLLGYRHIMACKHELLEKMRQINANRGGHGLNITEINYLLGESAAARSQNTFLLALDGDTDFSPGSIKILLDRMKDENVGAACGRIHPIGNGPMVWYQKFEYAIGHWLQKAAEHVFGCVLCSPGCFSLFRGAALMDTNVMKKYTTEPTEPGHHLQYDQGEDRWLCTLMLQQGYRIEYAAAADAWTFAPEGFNEFFNQRRRWMPSTIANILDLLGSASLTTKKNANMSVLYIGYQWLLMLMTILGPGTILMMIAGAVKLVFLFSLVEAYLFATIPAAAFTLLCFWAPSRIQLILAAILSVVYTFVMMIVLVGTIITATTENIFHPSVIVIVVLMGIFIVSGFCHPKEIWCLVHGILYLLTIPSGYLLLVIYSICNLNDVSWGTREVPTKAQRIEMEQKKREKEEAKKAKTNKGFLARIFNRGEEHIRELTNLVKTLIPERAQGGHHDPAAPAAQVPAFYPPGYGFPQDGRVIDLLSRIENNLGQLLKKSGPLDGDDGSLDAVVVQQPRQEQPQQRKEETTQATPVTSQPAVKAAEPPKAVVMMPPSALKKDKKKKKKKTIVRDELVNPLWAEDKGLGSGLTIPGNKKELEFWREFVTKYLLPIYPTPEEKKKIADGLRDLRNSSSFGMIIINLLWMALNFMFQYTNAARFAISYTSGSETYEIEESVLGMSFVFLLLLLLFIQMFGMFIHRMGTLQHLLAITEIRVGKDKNRKTSNEKRDREDAIRHIKEVLRLPATDDAGAVTQPPTLAPADNKLGVTFVGASTKGSMGVSNAMFAEQIGQTIGKLGPLLDAQRHNNRFDHRTQETLQSVRQRLTMGNARQKLKFLENDELGKSFRPLLPPRPSKHQPKFLQPNQWGFTQRELRDAQVDLTEEAENTRFQNVGAMGRTLFQRTKIINETTHNMENINHNLWGDGDVAAGRTRPRHLLL